MLSPMVMTATPTDALSLEIAELKETLNDLGVSKMGPFLKIFKALSELHGAVSATTHLRPTPARRAGNQ